MALIAGLIIGLFLTLFVGFSLPFIPNGRSPVIDVGFVKVYFI